VAELRDVGVRFGRGGAVRALDGVSLTVRPGAAVRRRPRQDPGAGGVARAIPIAVGLVDLTTFVIGAGSRVRTELDPVTRV
jgi:hypothetical protein